MPGQVWEFDGHDGSSLHLVLDVALTRSRGTVVLDLLNGELWVSSVLSDEVNRRWWRRLS